MAKALGRRTDDLTVAVLDRPRHTHLVESIRATGAMIRFLPDGDVAGAIMAASEGQIDTGVDLLLGTGGTPEGVIAAAALRCLGGEIFARLAPRNDEERSEAINLGYDLDRILTTRIWWRARTSSSRRPASPTARCSRVCGSAPAGSRTTRCRCAPGPARIRFIETYHDPDRSTLVPPRLGRQRLTASTGARPATTDHDDPVSITAARSTDA